MFDPHRPFDAPPHYAQLIGPDTSSQNEVDRYDTEIRYTDHEAARCVQAVGRFRRNRPRLIVIAGDHGEGLGDHGWPAHNRYTYEEEVRVPMILAGDVVKRGRVSHPVHLVDLAPTILASVGINPDALDHQGINLLPFIDGTIPADPKRPLFLQRPYYAGGRPMLGEKGPGFGLRKGRWKYFEATEESRVELYDLLNDPGEHRNIAAQCAEEVLALSKLISNWKGMQIRDWAEGTPTPEDEEALRSLGYVQ